jgi:hypothetical protein
VATEQEFNRYSIAYFDWDKALAFATEAQKHLPDTIQYEALLFAAIICYYRPFSLNEKEKNASARSQLRIEDFPPLSTKEQGIHDNCKSLRNKALAHSELSFNPTGLNPNTGVIASKPFSLFCQPFDLSGFVQLVKKLTLVCHHKRANHVVEKLVQPGAQPRFFQSLDAAR